MILALLDDGPHFYQSPADLVHDVEPLNADDIRVALDETGHRYRVDWIEPNQHGRLLGLLAWSRNGEYRLVRDAAIDPAWLRTVIDELQTWLPDLPAKERHQTEEFLAHLPANG